MRKEQTAYRRVRRVPGHPLAPPSGGVPVGRLVLYDKIGGGTHACHWCGVEITWMVGHPGHTDGAIIADHVNNDPTDDRPENVVAACQRCNNHRMARVGDDEPHIVRANGTRLRGEARECETCGGNFVAIRTGPGRGRFCSRSCARKAPRKRQTGASTASS